MTERRVLTKAEQRLVERFTQLAERAGSLTCEACGRLKAIRRPNKVALCGGCWRDSLAGRATQFAPPRADVVAPRDPLTASLSEIVHRKR